MKKTITTSLLVLSLLPLGFTLADVLTLKDGQTLTGTLVSKDSNGIVFEIAGQKLKFDSTKVQGISFGDEDSSTSQPTKQAADQPSQNKENLTAPVGTRVVVKTNTTINSKQHKAGHKFTTRLEADLVSGKVVIAPRGATIYGVITQAKQSGRAVGSSSLEITFTDIMVNNQMVPIKTTGVKAVTASTGKTTVARTARLAAIGGLANGSKGAKNSAKVGLGLSLLSGGNSINIPTGTLLEFQLAAPLSK